MSPALRGTVSPEYILVGALVLAALIFIVGWLAGWWWPKTVDTTVPAADTKKPLSTSATSEAPSGGLSDTALNLIAVAIIVFLAFMGYLLFSYWRGGKGPNEQDDVVNQVRAKLNLEIATQNKPPASYEHAVYILSTILDDRTMDTEQREIIAKKLEALLDKGELKGIDTMEKLMVRVELDEATKERVTAMQAIDKLAKEEKLENNEETNALLAGIKDERVKTFVENKLAFYKRLAREMDEDPDPMDEEDEKEFKRALPKGSGWASLMGMPTRFAVSLNKPLFKEGQKRGKNFLFYGKPGTGKSKVAEAMAIATPGSFLLTLTQDELGGVENSAEAVIVEKFQKCKKWSKAKGVPAVLLIDEADSIVLKQGARTALQLAMDKNPQVSVIFVTNYPKTILKNAPALINRVAAQNRYNFDEVDVKLTKKLSLMTKISQLNTNSQIELIGSAAEFQEVINKIAKDAKIGNRDVMDMVDQLEDYAREQGDKISPQDIKDVLKAAQESNMALARAKDVGRIER
jgi:DNA polymerase III delta prime subunit